MELFWIDALNRLERPKHGERLCSRNDGNEAIGKHEISKRWLWTHTSWIGWTSENCQTYSFRLATTNRSPREAPCRIGCYGRILQVIFSNRLTPGFQQIWYTVFMWSSQRHTVARRNALSVERGGWCAEESARAFYLHGSVKASAYLSTSGHEEAKLR